MILIDTAGLGACHWFPNAPDAETDTSHRGSLKLTSTATSSPVTRVKNWSSAFQCAVQGSLKIWRELCFC